MASASPSPSADPFAHLRQFDGEPKAFWSEFAATLRTQTGATAALIAVRQTTTVDGTPPASAPSPWRILARNPADASPDPFPAAHISALMDSAITEGFVELPTQRADLPGCWIAAPVRIGEAGQHCIAVLLLPQPQSSAAARDVWLQMRDLPGFYQISRQLREREQQVTKATELLDLLTRLRTMPRFESAGLLLCNELAQRFGCEQVAIAWKTGDKFRIRAISHTPRFEGKMALVQAMEQVAEESADQGEDIVLPPPDDGLQSAVTHAHQQYAKANNLGAVGSVCLWQDNAVIGVIILQNATAAFSLEQLRALRVVADQVVEPLHHAHLRTGWVGRRIARAGREWARRQWNLEHPWLKLGVLLFAITGAVLIFGQMTYRVEAPFVLRTADQRLIPAPFDGFVESVHVRTGDFVESGTLLALMDRSELWLQEISLLADQSRYTSEIERSRARNEFAEMRVAHAQRDQTNAALTLVRAQIEAAQLRAPFAAVVADDFGLPMRAGAPVRRGDVLIRLARLDALFLEIDLKERDIHQVRLDATGQFAFASRPDLTFAFFVERIEPMGLPVESGNIFRLRGTINEPDSPDWWRPGMSGVVKIEVGRRSFLWILTHRLVDWLRLQLWI